MTASNEPTNLSSITPSPRLPESPPAREASSSTRDNTLVVGGIWMIVLAALLFLCGGCSLLFYILIPLTTRAATEALSTNVVFGAAAGVGVFLGGILLWQGIVAALGRNSIPAARAFPPFGVFVLAFCGAVLLGISALALPQVAPPLLGAYVFPPWHFLASLLAPLGLLAYAARRLGKSSGFRALVLSFGWGAMAATTLAVILEVIVLVGAVVAAAIVLAMLPNSQALLMEWQRRLVQMQRTRDFAPLLNLLSTPLVTGMLLLYFSAIIPVIEEGLKALVVAFANPLTTRRADALLWGIAAGAGFAMMENMFNSATELTAWAFLVILRVGAAIVHVTNGANMGLGWYSARVLGKWGNLIIAYLVSMAYHAAWNATALILSTQAKGLDTPVPLDMTVVTFVLLGVLVGLAIFGLAWTANAIRRERSIAPAANRERRE